MIRFFHIVLFLFLCTTLCSGQQNRTNTWVLGNSILLDFNEDPPVPGVSALESLQGFSAISDPDGNLLFYTNGIRVWSAAHQIMPNGFGLNSDLNATNAALIVPQPGSDNLYYIFTVAAFAGNYDDFGGIAFSIVDMNLNGGLGDVIEKNTVLHTKSAEKLCATLHENGIDYWIMSHDYGDDQFRAFRLTSNGLNFFPVISRTGAIHREWPIQQWGYLAKGSMRFSPSGCKLALVMAGAQRDTVQLFDFDNSTGYVFSPVTIRGAIDGYNPSYLCFSPDNEKLYLSGYDYIVQFDLTSNVQSTIQQSRKIIAINTLQQISTPRYDFEDLQIAPNGKIYVSRNLTDYISSIDLPNNSGAACNFVDTAVVFPGNYCAFGMPNFVSNYLVPDTTPAASCIKYCPQFDLGEDRVICDGDSTIIELEYPQGNVMWNDGSTSFLYSISEEGNYTAVYDFRECPTQTDSIYVDIIRNHSDNMTDTTICLDTFYIITLPDDGNEYSWSNGITGNRFTTYQPGSFQITITKDDCIFLDTFQIMSDCPPEIELPNVFTPNNDGMNDHFIPLHLAFVNRLAISIYDRWGKIVHQQEGTNFSWDGYHNNVKCSGGVYFYTVSYTSESNKQFAKQGYITLLD